MKTLTASIGLFNPISGSILGQLEEREREAEWVETGPELLAWWRENRISQLDPLTEQLLGTPGFRARPSQNYRPEPVSVSFDFIGKSD